MNICFVTPEYRGYTKTRGIARYLEELIRPLARSHNIIVVTKSHHATDGQPCKQNGVTFYPIFCRSTGGYSMLEFAWKVSRLLPKLVRDHQIQIIEAPETHFSTLFVPKIKTVRWVLRLHTPLSMLWPPKPTTWMIQGLETINARKYDIFSAPSRATLERVRDHLRLPHQTPTVVVPHGISPQIDYPLDRQQAKREVCQLHALSFDKPLALFIGSKSVNKGIHILIEAARQLPEINFICMGVDDLDGLKAPANVKAVGYQEGADKSRWLHAADMLLVPSYWETFAIVVLEGMKYQVPLIVSRAGGLPEVVDDETAYLITPGSSASLVEAINALQHSAASFNKVRRAYERFIANYTVDTTSLSTTNLYKAVMLNKNIESEIPITGQHDLLHATSNINFKSVLDVGLGRAGASKFFAKQGKQVTAIGLDIKEHNLDLAALKRSGIEVVECPVENMSFPDESFDAVWMAHMLEHSLDPHAALRQVRRVLKPGGWLFMSVPPYKSQIVSGHIYTGWNVGQLMYLLLQNGFDIKDGHFVRHGYNIAGFVRKSSAPLPQISAKSNDIEVLAKFWPKPLRSGFEGNVSQVNWPGFKTNYLRAELGPIKYLRHKLKKIISEKAQL